ncbi:MAG: hypothetical protein ABNH53_01435 [Henriciella sp.]
MQDQISVKQKRKLGLFSAISLGSIVAAYIGLVAFLVWGLQTGWLYEEWVALEPDGRASVVSSLITSLGLLTSAIVLPFVFKDRIANLNDMVTRTERDLTKLNSATSAGLDSLTGEFKQELEKVRFQAQEKADESQDLVRALHLAVTTMLGNGVVTDSAHAKHIVEGLWEKVKFAIDERVRTKPGLYKRTREQLNEISRMSGDHLDALEQRNIVTYREKQQVLKLRTLHYAHSAPEPAQFGAVRELQEWTDEFVGK